MSVTTSTIPQSSDSFLGIPYTLLQLALSITIPLLIFYLGVKATVKSLKKKELARLIVLKEYYYLWVKEILKDAATQNGFYKEYIIGLYKLDFLSGVPFKMIDLTFEKLNSIDDKDLYKIFMELNAGDTTENAANLISVSKKLSYLNSGSEQLKEQHKEFIDYLIELRNTWNKKIGDLHIFKDGINKAWIKKEIPEEFFVSLNVEFQQWYAIPRYAGLKSTFNFLKKAEAVLIPQYGLTPENNLISDMLFTIQDLLNTYMMFHVYRLEKFKSFRYHNKNFTTTIEELNTLIEALRRTPTIMWRNIKSYQ